MTNNPGIRTPLNYTGNKSRLVSQFTNHFPNEIGVFVDLFCGGATVGLSVPAKKVIFIDNNQQAIALLQHLAENSLEQLLPRLERLVEHYGLSYSAKYGYQQYRQGIERADNNGLKVHNSDGYYRLRADYNALTNKLTRSALDMLYLLVVYAFNNDMRFNRRGEFNLPVGKTDLNASSLRRLQQYHERVAATDCEFLCADFRDPATKEILFAADFVYADPPYLITKAVYNEAGNWTENTEREFIGLLDELHAAGKHFALSNVLDKVGATNQPLAEWLFKRNDLHVFDMVYHYRSASYNKLNRNAAEREVLITNYAGR